LTLMLGFFLVGGSLRSMIDAQSQGSRTQASLGGAPLYELVVVRLNVFCGGIEDVDNHAVGRLIVTDGAPGLFLVPLTFADEFVEFLHGFSVCLWRYLCLLYLRQN